MARREGRTQLPQGTLDMLILRTLLMGPAHGRGIGAHIRQMTADVLQVEHAPFILPCTAWSVRGGSPARGRYAIGIGSSSTTA